jgi:cell division protein FtsL
MSTRPAPLRARFSGGGAAALSELGADLDALPALDARPGPGAAVPAGAPAPARPPLHVVPDPAPRRRRVRRARVLVVAAAVAVVAALFGVAAFQAQLVSGQVRLDQLERDVAASRARYQDLRLEVASLEAPERIVAEAQHRLGMVVPSGITYLSPAGVLDGPVPAGADAGRGAAGSDDGAVAGGPGPARSGARTWSSIKPHLGTASR